MKMTKKMKITLISIAGLIALLTLIIACSLRPSMSREYIVARKATSMGEISTGIKSGFFLDFTSKNNNWDYVKFNNVKATNKKNLKNIIEIKSVKIFPEKIKFLKHIDGGGIRYLSSYTNRNVSYKPFADHDVTGTLEVYKSGKVIEKTDFNLFIKSRRVVRTAY